MQTNNSKEKVRQLQNKLYLTAKKCDSRRFHALYDKVYRDDVLFEAWKAKLSRRSDFRKWNRDRNYNFWKNAILK